jgi:hypothetical protein
MFASWLDRGSRTERGTDGSAPWCRMKSTPSHARSTAARSRRSPSWKSMRCRILAKFLRLPVTKLSNARTCSPRETSACVRCDPMNPAAPVIRYVAKPLAYQEIPPLPLVLAPPKPCLPNALRRSLRLPPFQV